jgi:hypothetical protein
MAFHRPYLFAALVALPMSLVACGGGGGSVTPTGMHYKYVTNKLFVPATHDQGDAFALDLNGDGVKDNQLGKALSALSSYFNLQNAVDSAIAEGSIIFLVDYQTSDFTTSSGTGFQVYLGKDPNPAACGTGESYTCNTATPPVCTGCGHHLTGSGMFTIDPTGPTDSILKGKIANGTFTGGPGNLTLPLTIAGANLTLDLIGARVSMMGATPTALGMGDTGGAILDGGLTQDDLNNKVLPAIGTAIVPIIQRDCCGLSTSPGGATCNPHASPACGCKASSAGQTVLQLFDLSSTGNMDCAVSTQEIMAAPLIQSLLGPDVTINGKQCLSLGVKVTAVGATF